MNLQLQKISDSLYELSQNGEMLVPGRIYGNEEIIKSLNVDVETGKQWNSLVQIYNVACLPGIQKYSLAMSDVHPGYGFTIGGVGAFDMATGVISVAGVGFDINCGVRCLQTPLFKKDLVNEEIKEKLAHQLYRDIPAGVGSEGEIKLSLAEIDEVLVKGAEFAIERSYGLPSDLEYIENRGQVAGADPAAVSQQAKKRQINQIGTLGSGNHYLEVQYVEEIFDWETAKIFGLAPQQILVSIHCGSRGLGHQIGTDYLKILEAAAKKYQIPIRERELVCAPISSPEGRQYFAAVNAGINCAFANRQVITHLTRQSFARIMGVKPESITTFYEVGHNTVKQEKHLLDGVGKELMVHRKGATRAFGPGNLEVPAKYRPVGQPVLIGGTMGTHSYILHGTAQGMAETFGSACHGAGRAMSRMAAIKTFRADNLVQNLKNQGIIIKGHSKAGLAEEAPESYKDVDLVVNVMHEAGIIRKVAKLKPLICIKG